MMISQEILELYGATIKHFTADEIIFYEGKECQYYHQLASGIVRWTNIHEDGKECLQVMVESGECFGEFPLFDNGLYAATAISETDSSVYRLPKESFIQLLNEHPNIHFQFSRLLVQRLRFKFMILDEFSHQDPEHRIFSLLNYFRQTKKNICPETHLVKLTRQQIADMTALRVETVIRTMRQMHTIGKIQIHRGRVFFPFMTEVISN